jgi:transcriptional regulator with XRE-family HTH domain
MPFSGQRLRDMRLKAGLSTEVVAIASGRSSFSIRDYELERNTPPVNVLSIIASVLDCRVDDFLDAESISAMKNYGEDLRGTPTRAYAGERAG